MASPLKKTNIILFKFKNEIRLIIINFALFFVNRGTPMMFRRSDLPKLDNNLSVHHQNQFPLPPSMPPAHLGLGGHRGDRGGERDHSDPEDLRVPLSSPPFSSPHSHTINTFTMGHLRYEGVKSSSAVKT